jgi:hypothetical protein
VKKVSIIVWADKRQVKQVIVGDEFWKTNPGSQYLIKPT